MNTSYNILVKHGLTKDLIESFVQDRYVNSPHESVTFLQRAILAKTLIDMIDTLDTMEAKLNPERWEPCCGDDCNCAE